MTASALATELSLPLFTIRLDALISKYMGETSGKAAGDLRRDGAHPRRVPI